MAVPTMSGRTYLSIGDVLSLLREEFPDVTISKIRFLESQGLVDPERSPSGYRKFYDEDVARLRWVLRKQRDQFLPLKVIRDRLAAAGTGVPADEDPVEEPVANGDPAWHAGGDAGLAPATEVREREGAHAVIGAGSGGRVAAGVDTGVDTGVGGAHVRGSAPGDPAGALLAGAAPGAVGSGVGPGVGPGVRPGGRAGALSGAGERNGAPRARARTLPAGAGLESDDAPVAGVAAAAGGTGASAAAVTPDLPVHSRHGTEMPRQPVGIAEGTPALAASPRVVASSAGAASTAAAADVFSPSVSGVSLSLAELCAATGLTPEIVASLVGRGLLAPMTIAGGAFYDEEALTVGKLVAEFARYGVEPRHLRMYRNAVEREIGLVEQVITPLLRQRNPEARQRALDAAADLARLGQSMRASLVRSELRRQLGG